MAGGCFSSAPVNAASASASNKNAILRMRWCLLSAGDDSRPLTRRRGGSFIRTLRDKPLTFVARTEILEAVLPTRHSRDLYFANENNELGNFQRVRALDKITAT